ncbi:GNAT family N-acetyltransferase [Desmospora activa]|uniref:Acetyltransferase (GNAT) family protein n=1 Tax=Desmospora activa DSM 45169 TaxID=1121389 RepID=A0A2T4Z993_9BACL|nr:GNAT family N-acetyltransferase [Desmospora activa]PTM58435.1 acetyltransferase (GNAT) family protein [Desmospora activa DSM 45169]
MSDIEIRRPDHGDLEALMQFFRIVVTDTFAKEGLAHLQDDIEQEIESKIQYLNQDLETSGEQRYFLIALIAGNVVGTIEYGPLNPLILQTAGEGIKEVMEIGTVFVHPDYQGRGIGSLLLNVIWLSLLSRGYREFCLDSGYTIAQKIWKKKFGEPDHLLQNYWGEEVHHMIWRRSIDDISVVFRNIGG